MNKKIQLLTIMSVMTLISTNLNSVEERNPVPFYYLNAKSLKLKINLKKDKLCRVRLHEVIQYKNTQIADCYNLKKRLSDSIKLIHSKNLKKNELNIMFVDENKKIITPVLNADNKVYTIKSMLYFKKTKNNYIELLDQNNNYYYFKYDPINIVMVE